MDRSKSPIFCVGCPRSGTTLLYHTILSSGDFVIYQAESDAFNMIAPAFGNLRSLANRKKLMNVWLHSDYFRRTGLNANIIREAVLSECRNSGDFLRIVMEHMARKQGVARWAENTPTHVLHIPEIKATIPNALFIHIIRDGRDVATSLNRVGWGWAGYRFPWDRSHGLLVAGLYWEWLVRRGRKYGRCLGEDYLEIRYEDLIHHTKETLQTVGAFIDRDLDYEFIQENGIGAVKTPNSSFGSLAHSGPGSFVGRWKDINRADALRLEALVGPFLRTLGYESSTSSIMDFTTWRLRAFYPRYRDAKQWVKKSPLARLLICRDRLLSGHLDGALSRWDAFSFSPGKDADARCPEQPVKTPYTSSVTDPVDRVTDIAALCQIEPPPVRFSIVVTCFNQRNFIQAAVESVLSQNHAGKEVIVVDDGSTDGSTVVLDRYANAVTLLKLSTNCGAIAARNRGAALAKGEYLVFLDGDDVLRQSALAVYEQLVATRHPRLILASTIWFSGAVPSLPRDLPERFEFVEYPNLLKKDRPIGFCASAYVVAREDFEYVGGWTPGIFHLDLVDLSLKLRTAGRTLLVRSPATVLYRIHDSNSIHSVPPFLRMAHHILRKEKAGEYPGGQKHRFRRYAWLGGTVAFWTKRAIRDGHWKGAIHLAASGWAMVLAAVISRSIARIKGRQPVEILPASIERDKWEKWPVWY
jgi:glycosyltransferase involved in cell wall biosynthesis